MTLWEILKANKTGIAPDMFTMLAASKMNGGRDRLHELSGTPPLSFTAKGKPLTSWTITGNTVQNGTPTPENPVEVQAVGDRTANLLNFEDLIAAPSGEMSSKDFTFPHLLTLYLKPNTTYTCASSGTGSTTSPPADLNRSLYFCSTSEHNSVNVNNPVTYTTDSTGRVFIGFIDYRTNAQQYLNKTAYIWLNEGSTALPYEPYGYKIPVVTRGKNLFNYNLMFQNSVVYNDYFNVYNLILKPYTEYEISTNGEEKNFSNPALQSKETQFIVCNTSEVFTTVNGGVSYKKKLFKTTGADGVLVVGYRTKHSSEGANIVNKADMDAGILWLNIIQTPITTPIYLPTPLYSGEVMRSDGTITRSDGTTETFTAPQIPTLNGTTVIDVDTTVKPESMTIKYRR